MGRSEFLFSTQSPDETDNVSCYFLCLGIFFLVAEPFEVLTVMQSLGSTFPLCMIQGLASCPHVSETQTS